MKTIKVAEATERQLDWLVAYAQGRTPTLNMNSHGRVWHGWWLATGGEYERMPSYSSDWAQGGTLIDSMVREGLRLTGYKSLPTDPTSCQAQIGNIVTGGPTPLIAAMRCFCCSRLGPTVEVPDELF